MPTAYTKRYTIIVQASLAPVANIAANHASWDKDGAGDKTFTVPLSVTGNLPATFYWCSTVLTPAQAAAIATRLLAAGATAGEVTPVPASTVPGSTRFAVYDAATWPNPDAILTSLGLQRIVGP